MSDIKLMDSSKNLTDLVNDKTCIGRLSECLSAKVTEERNGEYTADIVYPVTGKFYNQISNGSILKMKANQIDDEQLFRVRKVTRPINGKVTFYCNHISYDLTKTSVAPFSVTGASLAMSGIKSNMTSGEAFTFTTDSDNTATTFTNKIPQSARALLGGQSGSILDCYGGEYHWNNTVVEHHLHRGADNGVVLRYGKNITDLTQEESIESMYTAVMPYVTGDDIGAICGDLQTILETDEQRILNLDLSEYFDLNGENEAPTVEEINAKAQSYINSNDLATPTVNLTVSFVNLADTEQYKDIAVLERVALCDTVKVLFADLGVNATAKVIKVVYDVLKEKYESIEIGNAKSSLASTIADITSSVSEEVENQKSYFEKVMDKATSLITGGRGGHIRFGFNADGTPDEIYVMDTDSAATAVKVIRINYEGIGFSSTGINGPYGVAILTSGELDANNINVINLTANSIVTGTIQDKTGSNSWNLDTGAVVIGGTSAENFIDAHEYADRVSSEAVSDVSERIDNLSQHYTYDTEHGVRIFTDTNNVYLQQLSSLIRFVLGGQTVSEWNAEERTFVSENGTFSKTLRIGNLLLTDKTGDDGVLSIAGKKVGS